MKPRLLRLRPIAFGCALALSAAVAAAFPVEPTGIDTLRTAILIRDLRADSTVVSVNAHTPLIPASITKAVTVASLMNLADCAEQFATDVALCGTLSMPDSTLHGNIIVRTVGDPTIESRHFPASQGLADSIASRLALAGIKHIKGNVIISEEAFADPTVPQGTVHEDILWPYGATLQGANFRDNRFTLSLPSETTTPHVPGLRFCYTNPRGKNVSIDRDAGSSQFRVSGNVARGFSDSFAIPHPADAMHAEIVRTLAVRGITVAPDSLATATSAEETHLYTHLSPTFGDIMRSLMFRSDNLMAEGMLRALAPGGSRAQALAEERAVWQAAGVDMEQVHLFDGSGLSRSNRLTAAFLADILTYMCAPDFATDYLPLFPRAGREGTMRNFLKATPLEGLIAMKTGSMSGVQSYAGYRFDPDGTPTHAIVIIANGFTCSRPALKNKLQRLLLEIFNVDLQDITEPSADE